MQDEALTAREQEVLGLLRAGLGSKQIAQRLGISPRTVTFHRVNLWAKLGLGYCIHCGAELEVGEPDV